MTDQQIGDLPAQLERWQNAAYRASEQADALHEQKLDLQAIIGKQEEEIDGHKFALRELGLKADAYRRALTVATANAEQYAHGWLLTQSTFDLMVNTLTRWDDD